MKTLISFFLFIPLALICQINDSITLGKTVQSGIVKVDSNSSFYNYTLKKIQNSNLYYETRYNSDSLPIEEGVVAKAPFRFNYFLSPKFIFKRPFLHSGEWYEYIYEENRIHKSIWNQSFYRSEFVDIQIGDLEYKRKINN